jgi:hypothetical protein
VGISGAVLAGSLVVGAVLRVRLALTDQGLYWPDEIYQSLEQAHRLVFGYGIIPWEFIRGARSWVLPGLLAAVMKAGTLVGLTAPTQYNPMMKVILALASTATIWAAYLLARSYGASRLAAACGASLLALSAPIIYFSPRAFSDSVSVLPAVLGLALALRRPASRRAVVAGSALMGLAVLLRLHNGILAIGLLAILAARRDRRALVHAGVTLGVLAIFSGLLDQLTWGGWFHSTIAYLQFNVGNNGSAGWGTSSVLFYPRFLWHSMRLAAVAMVGLAAVAFLRARGLFLVALAFGIAHSAVPHKESRFILVLIPILAALAGVGLTELQERLPRHAFQVAAAAVLAAAVTGATILPRLTWGDLGQDAHFAPNDTAYHYNEPFTRLMEAAYSQPDLCGLRIDTPLLAWTGGYTYLDRPVPFYGSAGPGPESGYFNYEIVPPGTPTAGIRAAPVRGWMLQRVARTCRPDPAYSYNAH